MRKYVAAVAIAAVLSPPVAASETTTYSYDALGRLTGTAISGGPNSGTSEATCFDPAGNRQRYAVAVGGTATCTPPANQPPVAVADSVSVPCNSNVTTSLTANDTDPSGNLPLTLVSITANDPPPFYPTAVSIVSASSVKVSAGAPPPRVLTFNYVVKDNAGLTATGLLTINITGTVLACNGGS